MADRAVGVALVGYGYWGVNLARNIDAADSLRLVGIVDSADERRAAARTQFPSIHAWINLAEALDTDEVEAVVIATPAGTHAQLAMQVLSSGRHVMVEKPLAMTRTHASEIVDAARTMNRLAMVGHTFLYSPPVQLLRRYVTEGELGAVQYLYSQRLNLGRIRRDCNALWNFAPHDVSIMLYLLGERPHVVSGTSFAMLDPLVPDVFFATLRFPSGIGAHLHVSWIDPRKTRLMTIVGDRKMAIYNDVSADQKLWVVDAGVARDSDFGSFDSLGDFQWRTRAGDILIPRIDLAEPLRLEMEAFGQACRGEAAPPSDAAHGAEVVAILEAIETSARENGVPVEVAW